MPVEVENPIQTLAPYAHWAAGGAILLFPLMAAVGVLWLYLRSRSLFLLIDGLVTGEITSKAWSLYKPQTGSVQAQSAAFELAFSIWVCWSGYRSAFDLEKQWGDAFMAGACIHDDIFQPVSLVNASF
jgi:hypothetical protein